MSILTIRFVASLLWHNFWQLPLQLCVARAGCCGHAPVRGACAILSAAFHVGRAVVLPADGAERRGYSNLACGWRLQHVTVVARLHECSEACSYVWWGCCQRFAPPTVAVSLPRGTTFRSLGYATLTRDYAILPMLGRSYCPMLAMLSLPYTGYAHAILCWCFILAYSDFNTPPRRGTWQKSLLPVPSQGNRLQPDAETPHVPN